MFTIQSKKSKFKPLFLLAASLLSIPAFGQDRDRSDVASPYYASEATSVTLPKEEYADLVAYLEQARDTLTNTLSDARKLGGIDEHRRLIEGVQNSLKQSGFKYDLMLFRHVLERALDIDAVYLESIAALPPQKIAARYDSANLVLLLNIRKAVEYYNSCSKRLTSEIIPVPNWVAFASDSVPLLEKEITLAPSNRAMTEIALRALGWTARALNTSLERKQFGREITDLMAMREQLAKGAVPISAAQQLLLEVLTKMLKAAAATPAEAPEAAYPKMTLDYSAPSPSGTKVGSAFLVTSNESLLHAHLAGGLGAIVENETQKSTKYFGQLNARAHLLAAALIRESEGFFGYSHALGDVRGRYAQSSLPIFRMKATAQADLMGLFGGWVAFEANAFESVKETILRAGWGPGLTFKIDETSYVLVRGGLGGSASSLTTSQSGLIHDSKGARYSDSTSFDGFSFKGLSAEIAAIVKLGAFLIQFEATGDQIGGATETGPQRLSASLDLTIPLGLIFGNDAIKVEGDAVHYAFNNTALTDITILQTGISYIVRW